MHQQSAQPRRYLIGNTIYVRVKLLDRDGEVVNPANLRLLVQGPTDTNSAVVSMSVDDEDYAVGEFTPDEVGTWRYRVETFTGAVSAAEERTVIVTARTVNVPA